MRNGPYLLTAAPADYPGYRYRGRYAYEHHVVWWRATGTQVNADHVIHHRNGDKHDNRLENLQCVPRAQHAAEHGRRERVAVTCGACGAAFSLLPSKARTRKKTSKSAALYCSKACSPRQPRQVTHGTPSGYTRHGCRCALCKAAHAARLRRYRAKVD